MKLLIATPSPFARKVRIALREKNIPCDETIDSPWNANAVAPNFNPLGKIPVLVTNDGTALFDSRVIVEYLENISNQVRLFPVNASEHIQTRQIEALADGICDAVVLIVMEHHRTAPLQSKDWIARQYLKVENGVSSLNKRLNGNNWFVGDNLTIGDISAACSLAYIDLRLPNFRWRALYPSLANFLDLMEKRASFRATRLKSQTIDAIT